MSVDSFQLRSVGAADLGGGPATDVEIEGLSVRICSFEHLLEMKRASERPRDRDDLEALEAAQGEEDSKS